MTEPKLISAFEIVLSEEQLEDLGRFTALFSQIDAMLFQIIAGVSKTPPKNLMALIEGTTSGQRLKMLRRLGKEMADQSAKRKVKDACSSFGKLIDKRNHIMHGLWSLQWDIAKRSTAGFSTMEKAST